MLLIKIEAALFKPIIVLPQFHEGPIPISSLSDVRQLYVSPPKCETHFHISIMVLMYITCICNAHTYVLCSPQNNPSTYPLLLQPVGADRAYLVSVPVLIVLYNITQLLGTNTSTSSLPGTWYTW